MPTPAIPDQARTYLASTYGGTVRNTVHVPLETCEVCFTPVAGYARCYACNEHRSHETGLADRVGAVVYAVEGEQSHYVMRLYKRPQAQDTDSVLVVSLLLWNALSTHGPCLARLAGSEPHFWASVPSLPAKPGVHPMHQIAAGVAPGQELVLLPQPTTAPRTLSRQHFRAAAAVPAGAHVLIIDDTWASGAHAQSAALAARDAGAGQVSILNVARYLKPSYGPTAQWLRANPKQDYDPGLCCWTGGACPSPASAPFF